MAVVIAGVGTLCFPWQILDSLFVFLGYRYGRGFNPAGLIAWAGGGHRGLVVRSMPS